MARPISLAEIGGVLTGSPFHQFLNMRLVRAERGLVEIALPFREEFIADPESAYIHGGVIAALADVAGCFAVIASVGYDVPTIDLRIDYLKPAFREDLRALGRTVKTGRTLAIADAEIYNAQNVLIAVGRGLFSTKT
jgi:uncharacterized protein (TIGR00369 family)